MVLLSSMTSTLAEEGAPSDTALSTYSPWVAVHREWMALDLHHLEIFFARAALGAGPVHRHITPLRAGSQSVLWIAGGFVVDPAANQAHPGARFTHVDRIAHY